MNRCPSEPRENWQKLVEECGLTWHSPGGVPYWNESAYYLFHDVEIDKIKRATAECYQMFLAVGEELVKQRPVEFGIPDWCWALIADTWNKEPPALNHGRFDFGVDADGSIKLLEFNCDTPTSLLEASIVQWHWKETVKPDHGQFNEIHETLLEKWQDIAANLPVSNLAGKQTVHFMCAPDILGEDIITTNYLRDIARSAGLNTEMIMPRDIGWDSRSHEFVDVDDSPIMTLFKLYPWEWLVAEPFGQWIPKTETVWIEPIWKMLWSNKSILPYLSHYFPDSPYLLQSWVTRPGTRVFRKPIFGREGRGVQLLEMHSQEDAYDPKLGRAIYQQAMDIVQFDGKVPIVGSWIVDGYPCGVGVREGGRITDNNSAFVPHVVR